MPCVQVLKQLNEQHIKIVRCIRWMFVLSSGICSILAGAEFWNVFPIVPYGFCVSQRQGKLVWGPVRVCALYVSTMRAGVLDMLCRYSIFSYFGGAFLFLRGVLHQCMKWILFQSVPQMLAGISDFQIYLLQVLRLIGSWCGTHIMLYFCSCDCTRSETWADHLHWRGREEWAYQAECSGWSFPRLVCSNLPRRSVHGFLYWVCGNMPRTLVAYLVCKKLLIRSALFLGFWLVIIGWIHELVQASVQRPYNRHGCFVGWTANGDPTTAEDGDSGCHVAMLCSWFCGRDGC